MSNLVIVAIPTEEDYVHKISSQKVPHLTLLFLGENSKEVKNLDKIINFVGHAAERSLTRFGLEVDRRGELGEDNADVLFFSKSRWSGFEVVQIYRSYLLKDDNIRAAYEAAEQFPEFIPHLTLGTSDAPAKPDTRDYPGTSYVNFDRIAVWPEEFDGPEFTLRREWDMEVAMSDVSTTDVVDDILQHYGKKGMKWGVRKDRSSKVTVIDKGKKLKTSGGYSRKAHSDAVNARTIGQVGKKSGFKALSNAELKAFNERLNLEQSAKRLNYSDKSPPKKFVLKLLGQTGNQVAGDAAKAGSAIGVKKVLKVASISA